MASALPRPWTVDEFLAWEREQAEPYELVDGIVRMMTGGTLAHTIVKGNLFAAMRTRVRPPCRVLVDGAKVVTMTASLYPDVVVTCAPVTMTDDTVREPRLIAEVLPRTSEGAGVGAGHDRGTKWLAYREIEGWPIICLFGRTCVGSSCSRARPAAAGTSPSSSPLHRCAWKPSASTSTSTRSMRGFSVRTDGRTRPTAKSSPLANRRTTHQSSGHLSVRAAALF